MSPSSFPDPAAEGRFFGKYRGRVMNNNDPLKLGRILADVPAIPGMHGNWALPCTPYAGPQVGFFALPPIGAMVWIEFEGGNPDYAIWVGCFWLIGELPLAYELNEEDPAQVKVFKTASSTLVINDRSDEGEIKLEIDTPAVSQYPVTMKFNSDGVEISTGVSNIKMDPEEGITATVSDTTLTMHTESIAGSSMKIVLTAEESEIIVDSDSIRASP